MLASSPVSGFRLVLMALAAAMILEGTVYFLAPGAVRKALEVLRSRSDAMLRMFGLALMVAGLCAAWLARP